MARVSPISNNCFFKRWMKIFHHFWLDLADENHVVLVVGFFPNLVAENGRTLQAGRSISPSTGRNLTGLDLRMKVGYLAILWRE